MEQKIAKVDFAKLNERVEKIEKFAEKVEMENLNERVQKLECMIQYQEEYMEVKFVWQGHQIKVKVKVK